MICPKCNKRFFSWRLVYLTYEKILICPNCKTQLRKANVMSQSIINFIINMLLLAPIYIFVLFLKLVKVSLINAALYLIFVFVISLVISQFTTKLVER